MMPSSKAAGPSGVLRPDVEYEVEPERGVALIEAGAAIPIRQEPETATLQPSEQRALDQIKGIGASRVIELHSMGILTLEELSQSDPEVIARGIDGVGMATASRWVREAQSVVEA